MYCKTRYTECSDFGSESIFCYSQRYDEFHHPITRRGDLIILKITDLVLFKIYLIEKHYRKKYLMND